MGLDRRQLGWRCPGRRSPKCCNELRADGGDLVYPRIDKICNGLPLEPEIQHAPGLFMVELAEVAQGKGQFQGSP